jgi:L-ribulose-5-phosphate 4-epimerase
VYSHRVAIKPSGVPYHELAPEHMVITKLDDEIVEGTLRPSSGLATHLEIYNNFQNARGVAHTHSEFATSWAQGQRPIPCLGTTHAGYFHGEFPITNCLTPDEIAGDYKKNTGIVISRLFQNLDPKSVPAGLVAGHGPFCWGPTATAACTQRLHTGVDCANGVLHREPLLGRPTDCQRTS